MPSPAISKPSAKSAAYGHVCTGCAQAKVKCFPRPEGGCTRCYRRGQSCVPSTPARRLGGKKAATSPRARNSRLEGKLDHLVSLIQSQQAAQDAASGGPNPEPQISQTNTPTLQQHDRLAIPYTHHTESQQQHQQQQQRHTSLPTPQPTVAASSTSAGASPAGWTSYDSDLTWMLPEQADKCLNTFKTGYLQYLPFLYFPPEMTAEKVRRDRPFLWLNIQGICARPPSKQIAFATLIREVLAKQYIVDGERSTDLLLGVMTYLTWSQLYNRGRPQMTMMSHIARALSYDLRINKDLADEALTGSVYAKVLEIPKPPTSNEVRRALLACFITSSVTTSFGRMAPLPWSLSMEEAARQLKARPETIDDEFLVAVASTRRIIDETSSLNKLHAEDPLGHGSFAAHIPALKAALDAERKSISPELQSNRLLASYFDHAEVCVYELVLLQASPITRTAVPGPNGGQNTNLNTSAKTGQPTTRPPSPPHPPQPSSSLSLVLNVPEPSSKNSSSSSSSLPHNASSASSAANRHDPNNSNNNNNSNNSNNNNNNNNNNSNSNNNTSTILANSRANARRLSYLTTCLTAAKRCLDNLLSMPATDFLYMTFSVVVQVLYALQTLNRLALVEGVQGWERDEVREVADGIEYMKRMETKLRDAGVILREECRGLGLGNKSAAAAMAGEKGAGDVEEESSFTKGAELLKKTAENWGLVLNAKRPEASGLKIDFQCVNFANVGRNAAGNGNGNGMGMMNGGGGGGSDGNTFYGIRDGRIPDIADGGGSVPRGVVYGVNGGDAAGAVGGQSSGMGGVMMRDHGVGMVPGPGYNGMPVFQPYGAGMAAPGMPFGGEMGDAGMYPGMLDYSWMSDVLGYWEL